MSTADASGPPGTTGPVGSPATPPGPVGPIGPHTAEGGWGQIQKAAATQLPTQLARARRVQAATARMFRGRARG